MSRVSTEDGEISDDGSDVTNTSPRTDSHVSDSQGHDVRTSKGEKKRKKPSRYKQLEERFARMEHLFERMLENQPTKFQSEQQMPDVAAQNTSQRRTRVSRFSESSDDDDDAISLRASGNISPSHKDSECEEEIDLNNNAIHEKDFCKKGLVDMFGDDAVIKKQSKKEGIILDKAQIDVIENSYRCDQPNYLSAFSEENFDLFPLDEESEKFLQVPSLDALVESCLVKRYGQKAAFVKSKGKTLFGQPSKMVEKIGYKGQQAARLALIMQAYIQQSLGNLLQFVQSDDFSKEGTVSQIKDIFAMTTKSLEQTGRAGAFHHITRRSVAMTDTALFEQPEHLDFSNLPLSGDGVFGAGLESLLKARKEKKKQLDDLIPDLTKKNLKRKSEYTESSAKRQKFGDTSHPNPGFSGTFRIPKLPPKQESQRSYDRREGGYRQSASRGRGYGYHRKPATSGRGKLARPDDK